MSRCIITVNGDRYTIRIDEDADSGPNIPTVAFGGTIESEDLTLDGREWRGEFPVPELAELIDGLKIIVAILKNIESEEPPCTPKT